MTNLDELFSDEWDDSSYAFAMSVVTPSCEREQLMDGLAELMERNKADPSVTDDLLEAVGWETAVAALRQGRISVSRGDFGEVLAAEAAEALDGLVVPVRKLRYQIDPNQTLPGCDVVAFEVGGNRIEDLEFIESKYRTTPSRDTGVDAHDQLAADRLGGFATTIAFLAHRLRETDADLYRQMLEYLADRGAQEGRHTIALTYDEGNWDERVVTDLDEHSDLLPELLLRRFPIREAALLVDEVYEILSWEPVDDE